jgi:hypothetical protein
MVYEFTRDESQDRWEGQSSRGGIETGAKPPETSGQQHQLATSDHATDDARDQQLSQGEPSNIKFPEAKV